MPPAALAGKRALSRGYFGGNPHDNEPKQNRGKPDPAIVADIVKRIVQAAAPETIVQFESAAHGMMGPDGVYDLLVLKGARFNYWRVLTAVYRQLPGTVAVDVILVISEDAKRY